MSELIPVSRKEALRQAGCPFSPSTLRKWHSRNTYPGLIVKIRGRLFVNMKVLEKIVEAEVLRQRKRARGLEILRTLSFSKRKEPLADEREKSSGVIEKLKDLNLKGHHTPFRARLIRLREEWKYSNV